jgi:hypothetical protein
MPIGEGRYLLRSNLPEQVPATLWEYYIQLIQVEEAFTNFEARASMVL